MMRVLSFWFLPLLAACSGKTPEPGPPLADAHPSPPADCMASAEGIAVDEAALADEDGYAPYAVDGCRLVYVSSSAGPYAGALVLRDFAADNERVLAESSVMPRRPAIAGNVIAWEEGEDASVDGTKAVQIRVGSVTTRLSSGAFHHAGEPRVAEDAVAFTGFLTADPDGDTDVFVFLVSSGAIERVAAGFGQQRFADISSTHVAISDFSEDPEGTYDPEGRADANIIVFDRGTKERVTRVVPGKQAYPMLGLEGQLAYLEWLVERPTPKLAGYTIRAVPFVDLLAEGAFVGNVGTEAPAIRPSARGGLVEWVEYQASKATLWRARSDLSAPKVAVDGLRGAALFAPQATARITVLASRGADTAPELRALPR